MNELPGEFKKEYRVRWRRYGWAGEKTKIYQKREAALRFTERLRDDSCVDYEREDLKYVHVDERWVSCSWQEVR